MSADESNAVHRELSSAAADVCSRQWTALGGLPRALGDRPCRAIVDPEALILLSFVARECDPRLDERLGWWARVGARHTSVQRLRSLARSFPAPVADGWGSFASVAAERGSASWRTHASDVPTGVVRERARGEVDEPVLVEGSTLLVRLRMGLGVNAKADLLALLIGNGGSAFSASAIARELAYDETTIKRAARDMARSGLVREAPGHPAVYSADAPAWARLLEQEAAPSPWRPWSLFFPFLGRALEWLAEAPGDRYVRASRARDLFDERRDDLVRHGFEVPRPERHPGEAFEGVFLDLLARFARWIQEMA